MAYTECERRSEMECADERGTPGERPAGATPRTRRGGRLNPQWVERKVDGLAHRVTTYSPWKRTGSASGLHSMADFEC